MRHIGNGCYSYFWLRSTIKAIKLLVAPADYQQFRISAYNCYKINENQSRILILLIYFYKLPNI
jgi:hypothetical protein